MVRFFFFFTFLLIIVIFLLYLRKEAPLKESFPSSPLWGFALDGFPIDQVRIEQIQNEAGSNPQIISFFLQWSQEEIYQKMLVDTLQSIWTYGAVPSLTWEPFTFDGHQKNAVPYIDVLNGKYNHYLLQMAQTIKVFGKPLIIRFAHEMNLNIYHWGTTEEEYGYKSPEIYIKMYRYVVNQFKEFGVKNILWAFCPNAGSVPDELWNKIEGYYPGDDYVDILGMDGYAWSSVPIQTFQEIFETTYKSLKQISKKKPIIVFETAIGGEQKTKIEWLKAAVNIAKDWKLAGLIWFQVDKELDWRILTQNNSSEIRQILSSSQNWATFVLKDVEFQETSF